MSKTKPAMFVLTIGLIAIGGEAQASCNLYEHENYRGRSITLSAGQYISNFQSVDFNDILTSIKVAQGCQITLYEHANKGGHRKSYKGNTSKLRRRDTITPFAYRYINDSYSSGECTCNVKTTIDSPPRRRFTSWERVFCRSQIGTTWKLDYISHSRNSCKEAYSDAVRRAKVGGCGRPGNNDQILRSKRIRTLSCP